MDGIHSTEFWLQLVSNIVAAALPIVVFYGMMTQEEAELWRGLVMALAAAVASAFVVWGAKNYTDNRTSLKVTALEMAEKMGE